jgi:hypothetical protein
LDFLSFDADMARQKLVVISGALATFSGGLV